MCFIENKLFNVRHFEGKKKFFFASLKGTILIEGEQHTVGNLFSRFLQDHKDIVYAGYKVGHPNVNVVEIEYVCKTSILPIINDVTRLIINVFDNIENRINNLKKFGYDYNI